MNYAWNFVWKTYHRQVKKDLNPTRSKINSFAIPRLDWMVHILQRRPELGSGYQVSILFWRKFTGNNLCLKIFPPNLYRQSEIVSKNENRSRVRKNFPMDFYSRKFFSEPSSSRDNRRTCTPQWNGWGLLVSLLIWHRILGYGKHMYWISRLYHGAQDCSIFVLAEILRTKEICNYISSKRKKSTETR